jgi:hypothetical protein
LEVAKMASKSKLPTSDVDSVAGHVASKFPRFSQTQGFVLAIVALFVGAVAFLVYSGKWPSGQKPEADKGEAPPPAALSSVTINASNSPGVAVHGDNLGNVAGRDVNVYAEPQRTKSDLAITEVRRTSDGVHVAVRSAGPESVKGLKGTITAEVIPEFVGNQQGTEIELYPSGSSIEPGQTVDFSARSSDGSIWYVTGLKVWSDENEDPNRKNSEFVFPRAAQQIFIIGASKAGEKSSWSERELNSLRSN